MVVVWVMGNGMGLVARPALAENTCELAHAVTASDGADYDYFGSAVAIDADVAVIGAESVEIDGFHTGAAYIFRETAQGWQEEQKIIPPDLSTVGDFGGAVDLDGELLIIGAETSDDFGQHSGSAYIFRYDGSGWVMESKLLASDGVEEDHFGGSVGLAGDLAIASSASGDDLGAVYAYRHDGSLWLEEAKLVLDDYVGGAIAAESNRIVIGAPQADGEVAGAGAVYLFHQDGGLWTLEQKLGAASGQIYDYFGDSVAISGDWILVGALYEGPPEDTEGAAYLFHHDGTTWNETQKLKVALDGDSNNRFAASTGISGDMAVVGVEYGHGAYLYQRTGLDWNPYTTLSADDSQPVVFFGDPVAISDGVVLVGDVDYETSCGEAGAAFIYSEKDCNANGSWDACELADDHTLDCNFNGIPDECDVASGAILDCNGNAVPDDCESDCNGNAVPDECDIAAGTSTDCQSNGIPDECGGDCNRNSVPDECDLATGTATDDNGNGILDVCEFPPCPADASGDGIVDPLDVGFIMSRLGCAPPEGDDECLRADVNADGAVDPLDVGFAQSRFGPCPFHAPVFGNPRIPVGKQPRALVAGDLNGDGSVDLVTANSGSDSVSVLMNTGNGYYAPKAEYKAGDATWAVAVADLDGDSDVDVAAANSFSSTVSILRNQGQGTFDPDVEYEVGTGPKSLAIGDLDGDGDLDVMTGNSGSSTVSVLLNQGDATFGEHGQYATIPSASWLALADLDADGDLDAAVVGSALIHIVFNYGDGSFSQDTYYWVGDNPSFVLPWDYDGDGDFDLLVTNEDDATVSFLANAGDGTFVEEVTYSTGEYPTSLALGDLDGDHDTDIAVAGLNDVTLLMNNGDLTFASTFFNERPGSPILLSDLDGDGHLDIAGADLESDSIPAQLNNGDGSFSDDQSYHVGNYPNFVSLGDLDGDGALDMAASNGYQLFVWLNNQHGLFQSPSTLSLSEWPYGVTLGDLDGDGDADAVVGYPYSETSAHLAVLFNEGGGNFVNELSVDCGNPAIMPVMSDLNNDGLLDVAASTEESVVVLLNLGNGALAPYVEYAVETYPWSLAVGDVDRDGDSDAVLSTLSSSCSAGVAVLLNDGSGGFGPATIYAAAPGYGLALRDLNGDDYPDIAATIEGDVSDPEPGKVSVFMNHRDGTFRPPVYYEVGRHPDLVVLDDMDLDGDADMVVVNFDDITYYESDTVSVLLNYGDGTFAGQTQFGVGSDPIGLAVGDIDGDADVDLAVANLTGADYNDGTIAVLYNRAVTATFIDDCNGNGIHDTFDPDCNGNGIPDDCDYATHSTFPTFIVENSTGLPDDLFLGPPDGDADGIGNGGVTYDLGQELLVNADGPDFNVYPRDGYGDPDDFAEIDVLISEDGLDFLSVKVSEGPLVRIPGDEALEHDEDARSYELNLSGTHFARYIRVETVDGGLGLWSGFQLDAVGIIHAGSGIPDCNGNEFPDDCDILAGTSGDCDGNLIPDECQTDCNDNGQADACDILMGSSSDCTGDAIPDECEPDCNGNGSADTCDLYLGTSPDCNGNATPDECDLAGGVSDCNGNAVPDECDVASETSLDCDADGVPDECQNSCAAQEPLTPDDGSQFDFFGWSLAVSGDAALVGAYGNDDAGYTSGAVYSFRYDGGSWVQDQKLTASDAAAYDYFGFSVASSGDVALIGAYGDDDQGGTSGAVYFFRDDGFSWVETQKLLPADGQPSDDFGYAVALDGNTAVISAVTDDDQAVNAGSAYVFRFDGAVWTEKQKLVASDGAAEDWFGNDVAVSGDTILIGVRADDDQGTNSGSAYVFHYDGSSWFEEQKLLPSDGQGGALFGDSLALEGDTAMIGAPFHNNPGIDDGAVYVFRRDESGWTEQQQLLGDVTDFFGNAVALEGDLAVITAGREIQEGSDFGATYVYRYDGSKWVSSVKLLQNCETTEGFGRSAALAAGRVLTGDPNGVHMGIATGLVTGCVDISDCNLNLVLDSCDIEDGTSLDTDEDGVPDECRPPHCEGDANGDGVVDPLDTGYLSSRFGCLVGGGDPECDAADVNGDGVVDPLDSGFVAARFGTCF